MIVVQAFHTLIRTLITELTRFAGVTARNALSSTAGLIAIAISAIVAVAVIDTARITHKVPCS